MEIPTELKTLTQFLQRAKELETREPIMCYYCKFYAAQLGINLAKEPDSQAFLANLLAQLEQVPCIDIG